MSTTRKQTGLRLDSTLHAKIKTLSDADGRPINNYIVSILRKHIADYEQEHGPIQVTEQQ